MPNPTPLPPPPLTTWQIIWRNLVALAVGVLALFAVAEQQFGQTAYLGFVDLFLGLITMVAYQFRRRWPFAVAMFAVNDPSLARKLDAFRQKQTAVSRGMRVPPA